MPLTPQEEQELAQLESTVGKGLSPEEEAELASLEADPSLNAQNGPINAPAVPLVLSPEARRMEQTKRDLDPSTWDIQPKDAVDAMAGSFFPGGTANPLKALGRLIKGGTDAVSRTAAGLSKGQARAYQKAPQAIEEMAKGGELAMQKASEDAITGAQGALKGRAGEIESRLQEYLQGKSIPESQVAQAREFLASEKLPGRMSTNLADYTVDAPSVLQAQREIGKKTTNWALDPMSGQLVKSTNPAAGEQYRSLGEALKKAAPEASDLRGQMQQGIELQEALATGSNRPLGFMTAGKDTAAIRQGIDQLAGTGLEEAASGVQAARTMADAPRGPIKEAARSMGRAGLRASENAAKVGAPMADILQWWSAQQAARANRK